MKKLITIALAILFILPTILLAKDVQVKGYYRKDGTYVRPHVRSSPDNQKWNNYGPSKNDSELMNPRSRDSDRDGIPNYQDRDDDDDGIQDDYDKNQYYNPQDE
jgi:hypothetical protein